MGIEMDGFDEVENMLDEIEKNADELDGENEVKFDDLFCTTFMKKYTDFLSIDEMFEKSDFDINSQEDFESISEDKLDMYVNKTTVFSTWEEMLEKAIQKWTIKKLGL